MPAFLEEAANGDLIQRLADPFIRGWHDNITAVFGEAESEHDPILAPNSQISNVKHLHAPPALMNSVIGAIVGTNPAFASASAV